MGIRGRLLLLAVGVALPLALFGAAALRGAWGAGRAQLDDSIRQQAELAAVAFERWVDAQRQPLTTISAMLEERDASATPSLADYLRLVVTTRTHWIDLRVVDAEGRVLSSYAARGAQPAPAALVEHLLSESQSLGGWVVVTDRTASEERPVFALAAPVRGGGAVVARVDGAAVSEIFRDIRLPERAIIAVYDAENRLLYRRPAAEAAVEQSVDRSPFFAELGDRRAAAFEFESPYDGVRRVYGLARAGASRCVAVVGVPSDVLYEPARRQQNRYLLFSLLALACAVAAALFVGRTLARPLLRLRETARRLGAGDLAARARVGGGEVGELGASFNLMAGQIAERAERLKELDRLKSEFVSSVSHELRTPLTTIKTLTRVLQRGRLTDEERGEYLETIAAECDRQIDLVLNLLDLSRIESGAYRVALARVDLAEVVEACARVVGRSAQVRGVALSTETADDVPHVLSDAGALRRVVCGLVENAIKYTPAGGRVTIRAGASGEAGAAEVAVEDTGRGIRREDLAFVFDKFFRGRPAAPPADENGPPGATPDYAEAPGVGLGLYLARSIVNQLGGTISAQSPPPGKNEGAVFTVRLPAWQTGAGRAEEARDVEPVARG